MLITPEQAFRQQLRDVFLVAEGSVAEILPDDITGIKHQRFIILTESGLTLLIVNNLERSNRIKLHVGEKVHIEGTYVWNRHGGLMHETHEGINKEQPEGEIIINKV